MNEERYKTGILLKGLPTTTREQLAWLQDERQWINMHTLFIQAISDLYEKERNIHTLFVRAINDLREKKCREAENNRNDGTSEGE